MKVPYYTGPDGRPSPNIKLQFYPQRVWTVFQDTKLVLMVYCYSLELANPGDFVQIPRLPTAGLPRIH